MVSVRLPLRFSWLLAFGLVGSLTAQDVGPASVAPGSAEAAAFFPEYYVPELQPILQASLAESPNARYQAARREEADGQLEVARTDYHWQVSAYARYTGGAEYREDIGNGTTQFFYSNVVGRRPLYHWGKLDAREAQAIARQEQVDAEVGLELQNQLQQIREAYLRALAAQERRRLADDNVTLADRIVAAHERLLTTGQIAEAQLLDLQVQQQEARERQALAQADLRSWSNRLERLTGREAEQLLTGVTFPSVGPWEPERLESWKAGIAGQPGLSELEGQRFEAVRTQLEQELYVAKRRYLPDLNLEVGVNTDRLEDINNEDAVMRTYAYGGLSIDWKIWDGWRARAEQRVANARLRNLALEETLRRSDNAKELEGLFEELDFNRLQIGIREHRAQLVRRQLELAENLGERSDLAAQDRLRLQLDYERLLQDARDLRIEYLLRLSRLGLLAYSDPVLAR